MFIDGNIKKKIINNLDIALLDKLKTFLNEKRLIENVQKK